MLDKSDFEQIAQLVKKVVRYEIDDAIANLVKIIMETMASKEDLMAVESKVDKVQVDLREVQVDLREVKEKVNRIEERLILPEEINNLNKRTIKLEKIHLKELAYA